MANIFIDGDEITKKSDIDPILGNAVGFSDSINNHLSTGVYSTSQMGNVVGYPTDRWGIAIIYHSGNKTLQFFSDDQNNLFFRGGQSDQIAINNISFNRIATDKDIEALKARVSALEKQIGGALSSALNHLFKARKVVF